jgi:hypothetical protein
MIIMTTTHIKPKTLGQVKTIMNESNVSPEYVAAVLQTSVKRAKALIAEIQRQKDSIK